MIVTKRAVRLASPVAWVRLALFMLVCAVGPGVPESSGAAPAVPWQQIPVSHLSRGEKLADLLRDFGGERGVTMVISDAIIDTVHGSYRDYAPGLFFDELCRAYGLVWFFDGATCYVYRHNELRSAVVSLGRADYSDVSASIRELGVSNGAEPLRQLAGKNLVYVTGPPKFVELAQAAVDILDKAAALRLKEHREERVIRAFRLKNGWATDHKFIIADEEVTVPGVATELKNLLRGDSVPFETAAGETRQLSATVDKLRGTGLAAREEKASDATSGSDGGTGRRDEAALQSADDFSIQADARLNAIIVRDTRERLSYYEELIGILDVPARLINIEVTIAEVSTGSLRELGVQWRYENTDGNDNVFDIGVNGPSENFGQDATGLGTGRGLNLATTLSLSASEYLLAKLTALENTGEATIKSKPSLLTFDNIQAVIEQTTTFYTKVAGNEDVDLFKVTSGLVLKVVPHIISDEDDDTVKIKLLVDIEDGNPDDESTVDEIPVVSQSTIHTQAVVDSGETLLLGGNIYEKNSVEEDKVPLLGDIPLLGYLFKYEVKNSQRVERIFMIRPTLHTRWAAGAQP